MISRTLYLAQTRMTTAMQTIEKRRKNNNSFLSVCYPDGCCRCCWIYGQIILAAKTHILIDKHRKPSVSGVPHSLVIWQTKNHLCVTTMTKFECHPAPNRKHKPTERERERDKIDHNNTNTRVMQKLYLCPSTHFFSILFTIQQSNSLKANTTASHYRL